MNPLPLIDSAMPAAASPTAMPEGEHVVEFPLFASFVDMPESIPDVPFALPDGYADAEGVIASSEVVISAESGQAVVSEDRHDMPVPAGVAAGQASEKGVPSEPTLLVFAKAKAALPDTMRRGQHTPPMTLRDGPQTAVTAQASGDTAGQGGAEPVRQPQPRNAIASAAQSMIEGRIADRPAKQQPAPPALGGAPKTLADPDLRPQLDAPAPEKRAALPAQTATPVPVAEPMIDRPSRKSTARDARETPLPTTSKPPLRKALPHEAMEPTKLAAQQTAGHDVSVLKEKGDAMSKAVDADPVQGLSNSEKGTVSSASSSASLPSPPETARHVAQQLAAAIMQSNGKSTEIALNPEELGRVRLSLTAGDGSLTLIVISDRAETQDLLRRHIDVLAQEFRSLGYDSLSFSFGRDSEAASAQGETTADEELIVEAAQDVRDAVQTTPLPASGLDLRL